MNNEIFDVVKSYKNELKNSHSENIIDKFDEMTKESGIDIEENRKTIREINGLNHIMVATNKKIKKLKLLSFLIWIVFAVAIVFSFNITSTVPLYFAISVVSIIVGVAAIVFNLTFMRKKINSLWSSDSEDKKSKDELMSDAWNQMEPLNNLFEWPIPQELVKKTTPLLDFDNYFNNKSFAYLNDRYNISNEFVAENESALIVKFGTIIGNPFLFIKKRIHEMGVKTYNGSLTITWTKKVSNGNGGYRTEIKSEVLTASVVKPFPEYSEIINLLYFSDAAPNLTFSRKPSSINYLNKKQMEQFISKKTKELDKLAKLAIKRDEKFNLMNNYEFESLFGASDRDNEIEFRMLFSSLGQKQMLDLLKDKEVGFGDDFHFYKNEKINLITSEHLSNDDSSLNPNPDLFIGYDYENIKDFFINFNNKYFKDILFALAPILSIPVYQDYASDEFIYESDDSNYSAEWEQQTIANEHKEYEFRPEESTTHLILKTKSIKQENGLEEVEVQANSYTEKEMVDYVSVRGGDGFNHDVPVPWIKYIPVSKSTNMIIKNNNNMSRNQFITNWKDSEEFQENFSKIDISRNRILFRNKLVSFLKTKDEFNQEELEFLNKKFK